MFYKENKVTFISTQCDASNYKTEKTCLFGCRVRNVYVINLDNVNSKHLTCFIVINDDALLWYIEYWVMLVCTFLINYLSKIWSVKLRKLGYLDVELEMFMLITLVMFILNILHVYSY